MGDCHENMQMYDLAFSLLHGIHRHRPGSPELSIQSDGKTPSLISGAGIMETGVIPSHGAYGVPFFEELVATNCSYPPKALQPSLRFHFLAKDMIGHCPTYQE